VVEYWYKSQNVCGVNLRSSSCVEGEKTHIQLQVVFCIYFLHQSVHFRAFGVRVLPELPRNAEGIHVRVLEVLKMGFEVRPKD
jgi:hypothetical protein